MRKTVAALLALALLLGLSGCAGLFEGEYTSSEDHRMPDSQDRADAEMTLDAGDYAELLEAVNALVDGGVEYGVVRMPSYDGDMEADLAQAVTTAANETPMGAFCAYYINYSIVQIVSVYEAHVSILYRRSPEEARSAVDCESVEKLRDLMLRALIDRRTGVTLRVTDPELDAQAVTEAVELAYYENPGEILYIPTCTVNAYPETGPERLLEIELSFQYANTTVETRRGTMMRRARTVAGLIKGGTNREKLTELAEYFKENVVFDEDVSPSDAQARRYNAMTAYGALVQGSAVGEGYAMAMKVLCDELGIECRVIRGRLNNLNHAWNLVRLDNGELYHLDCSHYDGTGAVYRNDEQQIYLNYSWDASQYPACGGESLYGPEFDPPEPSETEEPPEDQPAGEPGEDDPSQGEEPPEGADTPGGEDPSEGETPPEGGEPPETETPPEGPDPSAGEEPSGGEDPSGDQEPPEEEGPAQSETPSEGEEPPEGGGTEDETVPDTGAGTEAPGAAEDTDPADAE